jgi:hypothetical protein
MVLDFCILLGLAAPLLLSGALFLIVQRAVARRRIGPLPATLFYGLCVAALPLPVWWGVIALAEFYMVGDNTSIWASILRVGLAFLMYAYLGVSWALSLVAAGFAAWRFEVCARRAMNDAVPVPGGP